jgi:hypothetical protein
VCRNTFPRWRALAALIVVLAACGRERPNGPVAPVSLGVADTAGGLQAVASVIRATNERSETARAAPEFPANCRQQGLPCWKIETTDWQVSTSDPAAMLLARLLGVAAEPRSPGGPPPACPWWPSGPGRGYWVSVRVRFITPDLAHVALGRSCDNPPGYLHGIFGAWERFEVRRSRGVWQAIMTEVGIT